MKGLSFLSRVGDFFQERYSFRSAGSMYFIGACSASPDCEEDDPLDDDSDEEADWAPELTSTSEDWGEFWG